MKPLAIERAQERLDIAEARYKALFTGLNYDQFRPVWTEFLLALNAVFLKLERGSPGCGKSEAWINKQKNLRRTDPLLSYLKQARNSDEHGLAAISSSTPGTWTPMTDRNGVILTMGRIDLVEVVDDRFGDRYPVPTSHMKKPIIPMLGYTGSAGPWEVGKLGLEHARAMMEHARQLPAH